eukprot:402732-Amphidinium_carterae.1
MQSSATSPVWSFSTSLAGLLRARRLVSQPFANLRELLLQLGHVFLRACHPMACLSKMVAVTNSKLPPARSQIKELSRPRVP